MHDVSSLDCSDFFDQYSHIIDSKIVELKPAGYKPFSLGKIKILDNNINYDIDLNSERKKIIILNNIPFGKKFSYGHFLEDFLGRFILLYKQHEQEIENVEFILCFKKYEWEYYESFLTKLINYLKLNVIFIHEDSIIKINNFYYVKNYFYQPIKNNFLYDIIKKYFLNNEIKPFRKTYINMYYDSKEHPLELRINNENQLENLFINMGYESIYAPEKFKNFEEQINYFNEVKTLVAISSSGLANSLFMQPQTTLFELQTNITTYNNDKERLEIHNFWKNIANIKDLFYCCISNVDLQGENLVKKILNNKSIMSILNENY